MFLHQFEFLEAGVSYGSPVGQTQDGLNILSLSAARIFSSSICSNSGIHCRREQPGLLVCSGSLRRYYRPFVIWASVNLRTLIQSKRWCVVNKSNCFPDKSVELAGLIKCHFLWVIPKALDTVQEKVACL